MDNVGRRSMRRRGAVGLDSWRYLFCKRRMEAEALALALRQKLASGCKSAEVDRRKLHVASPEA